MVVAKPQQCTVKRAESGRKWAQIAFCYPLCVRIRWSIRGRKIDEIHCQGQARQHVALRQPISFDKYSPQSIAALYYRLKSLPKVASVQTAMEGKGSGQW